MLIEFGVENFRSFADRQVFSLIPSPDRTHPTHIHNLPDGEALLKTAAIYGKNASGKSNLLQAMLWMRNFVDGSATKYNVGDPISFAVPFRLDAALAEQPTTFSIKIALEGNYYDYEFAVNQQRVVHESLSEGKAGKIFDRKLVGGTKPGEYQYSGPLTRENPTIEATTRENALVLSVGALLNNKLLGPIYKWFKERFIVLDMSELHAAFVVPNAARMAKSPQLQERVMALVTDADIGIADLEITEGSSDLETDQPVPPELRELVEGVRDVFKRWGGAESKSISVGTIHRQSGTRDPVVFDLVRDESKGTQRIFAMAVPLLDAIDRGALLVVDEFDSSIHPLLARHLIHYFHQQTEKSEAQLVVATHDATLFDGGLFRRDELWLVDKHDIGKSYLYSLHDFKDSPRSSAAFQKGYLRGDYGGIPALGIQPGHFSRK